MTTLFAPRWQGGAPTRGRLRATLGGPLDGILAEHRVLPGEALLATPEHLEDAEAATLPCAAVTAWSALVVHGRVTAGDTVLALGTGGVSLFTLQLATLLGARVIVTSSSDEKLERAKALGAWQGVNYRREPAWGDLVRRLTGGEGVDLVVEVGGAGTFSQSLRAVRLGGTICLVGNLAGSSGELPLVPIFMRQVRIQGMLVGDRDAAEALYRAVGQHRLRPVIDRIFPFAEAPAAFRYLASGSHLGKVCIEVG